MKTKKIFHIFKCKHIHHLPQKMRYQKQLAEGKFNFHFILLGSQAKAMRHEHAGLAEFSDHIIPAAHWWSLLRLFLASYRNPNHTFILHAFSLSFFLLNAILPGKEFKAKWVCWGSGLNRQGGLKGAISLRLRRFLYSRLDAVNCLMFPDCEKLKEDFLYQGEACLIPYTNGLEVPCAADQEIRDKFNKDQFSILVGNDGGEDNRHLEIFRRLDKWREENFKVIVFLNYSVRNPQYAEQVKAEGLRRFGPERFVCHERLLPLEDYFHELSLIDITVLDIKQYQSGLAALYRTIDYGGVVYLPQDSVNRRWFDYLQIETGQIEKIDSMQEFSELFSLTADQRIANKNQRQKHFSPAKLNRQWLQFAA